MSNDKDLSVFQNRSVRACISDGYQLYMSGFYRVFRSSWLPVLFYAVVFGLVLSAMVDGQERESLGIAIAGMLGLMAVTVIVASCGFSAMADHQAHGAISAPQKWYGRLDVQMLLRTLMLAGWLLLWIVPAGVLLGAARYVATQYMAHYVGIAFQLVMGFIVLLLTLPLAYTIMKFMLTPKVQFLAVLKHTYLQGLKRIGALFMITLVVVLVTMLISAVILLPANILYMANVQSQAGVVMGDAAGMPDYMGWMNLLVFVLAGFIQAFVYLSTLFPYYYFYGTMEEENIEKSIELNK